MYDKLVMKVNAIDATIPSNTGLVTKILDDSVKKGLEKEIMDVNKKIPNTSGLVKKTDYNEKITEIENKIPDITNLVTKAVLNRMRQKLKVKIHIQNPLIFKIKYLITQV